MWQLYQFPLCPFSRKLRLLMSEKGIGYELWRENPWEGRDEFLALNPAGRTPVLHDAEKGVTLCDSRAICEYLEETVDKNAMIAGTAANRAEVRRLVALFDENFYQDVTAPMLLERMKKRLILRQAPNLKALREAMKLAHNQQNSHRKLFGNRLRGLEPLEQRGRLRLGILKLAVIVKPDHASVIIAPFPAPFELRQVILHLERLRVAALPIRRRIRPAVLHIRRGRREVAAIDANRQNSTKIFMFRTTTALPAAARIGTRIVNFFAAAGSSSFTNTASPRPRIFPSAMLAGAPDGLVWRTVSEIAESSFAFAAEYSAPAFSPIARMRFHCAAAWSPSVIFSKVNACSAIATAFPGASASASRNFTSAPPVSPFARSSLPCSTSSLNRGSTFCVSAVSGTGVGLAGCPLVTGGAGFSGFASGIGSVRTGTGRAPVALIATGSLSSGSTVASGSSGGGGISARILLTSIFSGGMRTPSPFTAGCVCMKRHATAASCATATTPSTPAAMTNVRPGERRVIGVLAGIRERAWTLGACLQSVKHARALTPAPAPCRASRENRK